MQQSFPKFQELSRVKVDPYTFSYNCFEFVCANNSEIAFSKIKIYIFDSFVCLCIH